MDGPVMMTRCTCIRRDTIGPVIVPDPHCPSWFTHILRDTLRAASSKN